MGLFAAAAARTFDGPSKASRRQHRATPPIPGEPQRKGPRPTKLPWPALKADLDLVPYNPDNPQHGERARRLQQQQTLGNVTSHDVLRTIAAMKRAKAPPFDRAALRLE
jgi:hypothetical protein